MEFSKLPAKRCGMYGKQIGIAYRQCLICIFLPLFMKKTKRKRPIITVGITEPIILPNSLLFNPITRATENNAVVIVITILIKTLALYLNKYLSLATKSCTAGEKNK